MLKKQKYCQYFFKYSRKFYSEFLYKVDHYKIWCKLEGNKIDIKFWHVKNKFIVIYNIYKYDIYLNRFIKSILIPLLF